MSKERSMSKVVDKLAEIEDQVVETVRSFQEPVVDSVSRAVSFVDEKLPELPTIGVLGKLPKADEIVDQQFEFVTKLIEAQREFVSALLEAIEPLTSQVRPAQKPKVAKVAKQKAGAAA